MTRMDDMEDPCQQGAQELLWRTCFALGVIADSGPCLSDMRIRSNCESGGRPTTNVLPDTQDNYVCPTIRPMSRIVMYSQQDMVPIAMEDREDVGFYAFYTSLPYNIYSSLFTIELHNEKINDLLKL